MPLHPPEDISRKPSPIGVMDALLVALIAAGCVSVASPTESPAGSAGPLRPAQAASPPGTTSPTTVPTPSAIPTPTATVAAGPGGSAVADARAHVLDALVVLAQEAKAYAHPPQQQRTQALLRALGALVRWAEAETAWYDGELDPALARSYPALADNGAAVRAVDSHAFTISHEFPVAPKAETTALNAVIASLEGPIKVAISALQP